MNRGQKRLTKGRTWGKRPKRQGGRSVPKSERKRMKRPGAYTSHTEGEGGAED